MRNTFILMLFIASLCGSSRLSAFTPTSGTICLGSTLALIDSSVGTWSSSNPAVATIGSTTGIITSVSVGVVTITYTSGSGSTTGSFTVSPVPAPIVGGTSSFCFGTSITLTNPTPGGTWSTTTSSIATVGPTTGVVTGVAYGSAGIYYTLPGGCSAIKSVTVDGLPITAIEGPTSVCAGSTITLTDSFGPGVWASSNLAVATIGSSTGILTGVSGGIVTITYSRTSICGTAYVTESITVNTTTTPGTIGGPATVSIGGVVTMSNSVSGGVWSCSPTSVATIGTSSGVVTGVAAGTATITYTVTGCGGPAMVTTTVSVVPLDGISGRVLFSSPTVGTVMVRLITYNSSTHMLEAIDSGAYHVSGTSVYYEFTGIPTDSFRIKASINDSSLATTGFMPTYHTGDFYWYNATVVYHTSGSSDINKDITMAYGSVPAGPGFIAGDVTTGANKGTAGSSPAIGLHMLLVNSTTSQLVQHTYTDTAGHYNFTSLQVGQTYYVFPDLLNYATVPYTAINLTAANPGKTAVSFEQHTISKTITPIYQSVNDIKPAASSVSVFPNPSNGKLFVRWEVKAAEKANLTISDVTGRIVYSNTVNMHEGTGIQQVALPELVNGAYIVNIQSATISYKHTLQVQH